MIRDASDYYECVRRLGMRQKIRDWSDDYGCDRLIMGASDD